MFQFFYLKLRFQQHPLYGHQFKHLSTRSLAPSYTDSEITPPTWWRDPATIISMWRDGSSPKSLGTISPHWQSWKLTTGPCECRGNALPLSYISTPKFPYLVNYRPVSPELGKALYKPKVICRPGTTWGRGSWGSDMNCSSLGQMAELPDFVQATLYSLGSSQFTLAMKWTFP